MQAGGRGVGGGEAWSPQPTVPPLPNTPVSEPLPYRAGGALPHSLRGRHAGVAASGTGGGEGGHGGASGRLQAHWSDINYTIYKIHFIYECNMLLKVVLLNFLFNFFYLFNHFFSVGTSEFY